MPVFCKWMESGMRFTWIYQNIVTNVPEQCEFIKFKATIIKLN